MKKLMLFFSILLLCIAACTNDDDNTSNPDLLGKWKLVAQLVDPGDGSGTFQPIESDLELEFLEEGLVKVSNGNLCSLAIDSDGNSTESYSTVENTIDVTCNNPIPISFEIKEASLLLYYSCIEACAQRYHKLP